MEEGGIITYTFRYGAGEERVFPVALNRGDHRIVNPKRQPADWTRLDFAPHPLLMELEGQLEYWPAAVDLQDVAEAFAAILSHEEVDCTVVTAERTYHKVADAQDALRSLFGLILATSACPVLSRLKPLALSHLPFATMEESFIRMASTYLLKQYYVAQAGGEPDWELAGLEALYADLDAVNLNLVERLRSASQMDANVNAMVSFLAFTGMASMGLNEYLEEFRAQFVDGF